MTEERMPPPDDAESPESSAPETATAPTASSLGDASAAAAQGAGSGSTEKPLVEPASPDVDIVAASPLLPGSHRGGFFRLPTAPVAVTVQSAPTEPDGDLTPAS